MQTLRASDDRGQVDLGWLQSRHSFSFGHYQDPAQLGHGPLRVINEDQVAPGQGFDTHAHSNMEIVSVVLAGALAHRDSLGTGSVIRAGDVQRMSAGTGVTHSEFNASKSEAVRFLQIWIEPSQAGLVPSYEQRPFAAADRTDRLQLIASGDARDESLKLHQDVDLYAAALTAGASLHHGQAPGRLGWVQVISGSVRLNGQRLNAGDGLALTDTPALDFDGIEDGELLLFDMTDTRDRSL